MPLWTSLTLAQETLGSIAVDWSSDVRLENNTTPTCTSYDQVNATMMPLFHHCQYCLLVLSFFLTSLHSCVCYYFSALWISLLYLVILWDCCPSKMKWRVIKKNGIKRNMKWWITGDYLCLYQGFKVIVYQLEVETMRWDLPNPFLDTPTVLNTNNQQSQQSYENIPYLASNAVAAAFVNRWEDLLNLLLVEMKRFKHLNLVMGPVLDWSAVGDANPLR